MNPLDIELMNWYASTSEAGRRYILYSELFKRNPTSHNQEMMWFWYDVAVWGR